MKAAFQNWISLCRHKELRLSISNSIMKTEEAIQMNCYKRGIHEGVV